MKINTIALILFLFIYSSFCIAQPTSKVEKSSENEINKKIEEIIDPLVKSNNFSGSVLIKKDGREIFNRSYGLLNREKKIKNSSQTRFFLASVSAMFTAAAAMKLVDEGKLSLDAKVSKFFPDFKHGDKMTIHHLLTERTGIPRIGSQESDVNYTTLTESPQTLDDLIGYFKDYPLEFEPGSRYRHSRSSYILLAKIIELVSGKQFGEYLDKEILKPLGMNNTGHFAYKDKYAEIPNLAYGYTQAGVTELELDQQIHWSSKTGHASVYSTAEDLAKFADALLSKKLLSADAWEKLVTSHHGERVGYGWFISPPDARKRYHMSGGSPGFSSYIAVFPDEKLTVIMLSNIRIGVPYFTAPKLASVVFGEPFEKLNLITPPDVDKKLTEKFEERKKVYYQSHTLRKENNEIYFWNLNIIYS